ncbi:MAG: TIGR04283 family arsenosugar biosynthesis glycosyltransferase [Gemmatimonadales bacterium]
MIGVVIPALNEEFSLPGLLADLGGLAREVPLDVVVADGGSTDGTVSSARGLGVRTIIGPRGRGRQLNAGAAATRGKWLLFLHADCRMPPDARRALLAAITGEPQLEAAVFRFAIDLPRIWKRFIEVGQALRERLYGLPYGDQGLLIRRELFSSLGGFPDIDLMEDVAMIRRLKRRGVQWQRLPAPLLTSGRRYLAGGPLRTWLKHAVLISLYFAGVSPHRLARWHNANPDAPPR